MNKWKVAPVVGEPPSWNDNDFAALPGQVKLYHACSFGNGNYGGTPNATTSANVKAASALAGHRITIKSATVTTGTTTSITLNWENKFPDGSDRTPTYEDWIVVYSVNGVILGGSGFYPQLFTGKMTVTDHLDNLPKGKLTVSVIYPGGYRKNMNLGIVGQNADNSITLTTIN
jgi:hypothetical protein